MGFFNNLPRTEIYNRAQALAKELGIFDMCQTQSGSCYGTLCSNNEVYKVRVSDHLANPNNTDYVFPKTIDVMAMYTLEEMKADVQKQIARFETMQRENEAKEEANRKARDEKEAQYTGVKEWMVSSGFGYFINNRTADSMEVFRKKTPHAQYIIQTPVGPNRYQYEFISKENISYASIAPYTYLDALKGMLTSSK